MMLEFDIDFTTNPTIIQIRRETKKTLQTKSADPYLFMYHDREFGTLEYYKSMFAANQTLMEKLRQTIINIPELSMKNENGKNRIHFHAFRKWFKTQVTTAGQSDFAEALMGHKSLKLVYFKQSSEARQKMYQKIEVFLTISDFVILIVVMSFNAYLIYLELIKASEFSLKLNSRI